MGKATGRCYVIGLTGSSGSGKSAAAKILSALGAEIIDTDAIARDVVKRRDTLDELIVALGGWVVDGQGRFDRARVSERAFADSAVLARLTEITHKFIIDDIRSRIDALNAANAASAAGRVIVIDAPLPVERGFLDTSDVVWVVSATRERRLRRVMERDGISAGAAEARFASQMADEDYERLADVVIRNNGDIGGLEAEIRRQYALLEHAISQVSG